ncbi:MAG: ROK family protein [Acidobacteriaceae bacterium]
MDLRKELAARFCWQPEQVRFIHDASAFLLGEITSGAARGAFRAAGITLGTGIGSGFSLSGRLLTHGFGIPPGGEIWNLPFNGGIVEDILSARAIQREYQRRTGVNREVTSLAAAAPGDAAARETFAEFGRLLGQALRATLSDFAPDVVVLGGGISHAAPLFLPAAQRELEGLRFRLEVSAMLDYAALVGAAVAWFKSWQCRSSIRPRIRFRHGAKRWCLELSLSSRACVQAVGGARLSRAPAAAGLTPWNKRLATGPRRRTGQRWVDGSASTSSLNAPGPLSARLWRSIPARRAFIILLASR